MGRKRPSRIELLRAVDGLLPYPAVFLPAPEGGFEVIFPNLAGLQAYGVTLRAARKAAVEMLTAEMTTLITEGFAPPPPSDQDNLIPDQDEPPGTRVLLVEPDKPALRRRLKLEKRERGVVLSQGLGRLGK